MFECLPKLLSFISCTTDLGGYVFQSDIQRHYSSLRKKRKQQKHSMQLLRVTAALQLDHQKKELRLTFIL